MQAVKRSRLSHRADSLFSKRVKLPIWKKQHELIYLRQDLTCSVKFCKKCEPMQDCDDDVVFVPDAHVLLTEWDVLLAMSQQGFHILILSSLLNETLTKRLKPETTHFSVFANQHHASVYQQNGKDLWEKSIQFLSSHLPSIQVLNSENLKHCLEQTCPRIVSQMSYRSVPPPELSVFPEYWTRERVALDSSLIIGTLYASSDASGTVQTCYQGKDAVEIPIQGSDAMNRALHGDKVALSILPGEILTAKVVSVLERKYQCCAATVESMERDEALCRPVNERLPCIRVKCFDISMLHHRVLVTIDDWPCHTATPLGHITKDLGLRGQQSVETAVLCHEHEIDSSDFSEEVLACLPSSDWQAERDPDFHLRENLLDRPVCTIDPPGCTDMDDALHCLKLADGSYEVGVHIADVTHFLQPDTVMDQLAAQRCTTVYLVDKRIDMIPPLLGSDLCSLVAGKSRFAISVLWRMNEEGQVLETRFMKSVIQSRKSWTYDAAQAHLDSLKGQKVTLESASMQGLMHLAEKLHQQRLAAGALTLASTESRIQLQPDASTGNDTLPMVATVNANDHHVDTHALVEEFMLLANKAVAEHLQQHWPRSALLRHHLQPPMARFDRLKQAIKQNMNVELKVDSSAQLNASLDDLAKLYPAQDKIVRILATRCMLPAAYITAGQVTLAGCRHYGLALPLYTHFTSPIRRYADVLVHRQLLATLYDTNKSASLDDPIALRQQCMRLNRQHRSAQWASRASVALYTAAYLMQFPALRDTAWLIGLESEKRRCRLLVERFGCEVHVTLPTHAQIEGDTVLVQGKKVCQLFDAVPVICYTQDHTLVWSLLVDELKQVAESVVKSAVEGASLGANVDPLKLNVDISAAKESIIMEEEMEQVDALPLPLVEDAEEDKS